MGQAMKMICQKSVGIFLHFDGYQRAGQNFAPGHSKGYGELMDDPVTESDKDDLGYD